MERIFFSTGKRNVVLLLVGIVVLWGGKIAFGAIGDGLIASGRSPDPHPNVDGMSPGRHTVRCAEALSK